MRHRTLYLLLFFLFTQSALQAQSGTIRGQVIDQNSGEPLIGVNVLVLGTSKGTASDMNGKFSLEKVPTGEQEILFRYISYRNDTLSVDVKADEVEVVEWAMTESSMETEAVKISAKRKRDGEKHILTMKRKSAEVVDGISAEQMSKSGASNAADAAEQVTGISVEGGKYVYVRGLSDRYSKTTLNGADLPGLDPNRNSVQMDLFPSNMLENMAISKSFTADKRGDFTGGLVDLRTKDFPEEFEFQYSSSLSYNPQANFQDDRLAHDKKKGDDLAMGAESREVPTAVRNNEVPGGLFEDDELLGIQSRSFSKDFAPVQRSSGLDQSHSLSFGDQKKLFGNSFGYTAGITYSKGFENYQGGSRNLYVLPGPDNEDEGLNEQLILDDERNDEKVRWGAIADLNYKFSPYHKLSFLFMRNQSGKSTARELQGRIPRDDRNPNYRYHTRTLSYRQRSIQNLQLRGEHVFQKLSELQLDWQATRTRSRQRTPDLSYFSNTYVLSEASKGENPDTSYSINPAEYSEPMRFYRNMEEQNTDLKADLTLPIEILEREGKIKGGVSRTYKARDFSEQRFNFSSYRSPYHGNPNAYFSDANMQVGDYGDGFVYMQDATELRNSYTGEQTISGVYGLLDFHPLENLRANVGLRMEHTEILTQSRDPEMPAGHIDRSDLLPSLNLSYELKENMKLRTGYSRTIARPTFREFAPFPNFDFAGGLVRTGNAELDRSLIDNYDLRWEFYPAPGELLSASLFAKDFHQPIERVTNPKAAHQEVTWMNVDRASLYGLELEARKSLGFISEKLKTLSVGGNLTLIHSQVAIAEKRLQQLRAFDEDHPETRDMFGQPPYIVNAFLNYESKENGWSGSLNYNITGPRLMVVSQGGTPNVYDQPVPRLHIGIKRSLGERFELGIRARNLLNPKEEMTQSFADEEYIYSSFQRGRRYSLSLKYRIGG